MALARGGLRLLLRQPPPPPAALLPQHRGRRRRPSAAACRAASSSPESSESSSPLEQHHQHHQQHHHQQRRAGYMHHELLFWHCGGPVGRTAAPHRMQPLPHPESAETKRRTHNLLTVSGLIEQRLSPVAPRPATRAELCRAHDAAYVDALARLSADERAGVHRVGDESALMPGGYEIAALAAGGAVALVDAVLDGTVTNGYALTRPPGHHAMRAGGGGYCLINNVAVAALHALEARGLQRVAVVDFDVHHGNGTQDIFYDDDRVLFISLHQDSNYPIGSGPVTDTGRGRGDGFTINVPLPPGSGSGAYRAAFDRVVAPALDAFAPQLVLVSAGYDAAYMDPLGHQMCSSEDFRYFARVLAAAAARAGAGGRVVACHEGGYSDQYVPFCALAFVEELAGGARTGVQDPYLEDVEAFGLQALQPWQDAAIAVVEAGPLAKLQAACSSSGSNGGTGGGSAAAAAPAARST